MLEFIAQYISYWPFAVFAALLLAGFNFPVSEDAIIILSATLAHDDKSLLIPTYIAIYVGIVVSDIISYFLGCLLSRGVLNIGWIKRKLTPDNVRWVSHRLEKHGMMTFIVIRFIPLGLRNMLFMGSGFISLPFRKFILFDTIAAVISSLTLYSLVYLIGSTGNTVMKCIGGVMLLLIAIGIVIMLRSIKRSMKNEESTMDIE